MRSNASLSALFLLLAGCVGNGGYSEFQGHSAAPSAGMRDAGDDGGEGGSAPDPYSRDPRQPRERPRPAQDPYARPEPVAEAPRLDYSAPGAGYERPGEAYEAPAQALRDPADGMPGPRGSSLNANGEARYDEVGYAGVRGVSGGDANGGAVVAVSRSVAPGTVLEVTALDSGRTILVLVTGAMEAGADRPLDLSPAAARQLGASGSSIPVRVRRVNPSPGDVAALRAGQPATDRPETPPVLLNALRKHLQANPPAESYAAAPQPYTAPRPAAPRPAAGGSGYYVQVGAFSNAANAQALARSLGGFVRPGGGLNRVQMGPYRSAGEAEAARANAAARGYGDARVFAQN